MSSAPTPSSTARPLHDPVIVMGMIRSGTTLLAEMVHAGGTPMFADAPGVDASYDHGIRSERPIAHQINHEILGQTRTRRCFRLLDVPVGPFPADGIERLRAEVGDESWGFKEPRTTLTYPAWCEVFPRGPRLYVYRDHREILCHFARRNAQWRHRLWPFARTPLHEIGRAWVVANQKVLHNIALDQAAERPWALVRYEELMEHPQLIDKISDRTGVALRDTRNEKMRRARNFSPEEEHAFEQIMQPLCEPLHAVYAELDDLRLRL